MSSSSDFHVRRRHGFITGFIGATSAILATAVFASVTSAASVTPTFIADGNSTNHCAHKVDQPPTGNASFDVDGTRVTVHLDVNQSEKSFAFSVMTPGYVVNDVKVKGSTVANDFDYGSSGMTGDKSLFSPGRDGGNGVGDPADARFGLSHVCFSFAPAEGALAVNIRSFTARVAAKAVTLRWSTASELEVLGYNVYGLAHGQRVKLNAHLIASKGTGANNYSFRTARAPARVWLQTIHFDGSRVWRVAQVR